MITETFYWAIDSRSTEGHGLIGRYWWFKNHLIIPPHLEGCNIAVFKTRKIARENLPAVKGVKGDGFFHAFPRARVVKVRLTVEEVSHA